MTITLTIAHSLCTVLRYPNQPILTVAGIPTSGTQTQRVDLIVHVAVAEIPVTLGRIPVHSIRAAKAIVPREQINAQPIRAQRADAMRRNGITVAWL